MGHLEIHHSHQRDDHHCRHNQQNIQRDSNTVAQNQPHRTPWEAILRIRAQIQNTQHGNKKKGGKIFKDNMVNCVNRFWNSPPMASVTIYKKKKKKDNNTVAQTNTIEHHGRKLKESEHEYETHHTEITHQIHSYDAQPVLDEFVGGQK